MASKFDELDWDFYEASTSDLTHGIHVYPARMIPQLARRAIETFSKPGDLVYDPFCGSGTVLVEARAAGRNAIGTDMNPLAVLMSRVKATPLDPVKIKKHWNFIEPAIEAMAPQKKVKLHERLDYWFKPKVKRDLDRIWRVLEGVYPELGDPYGDFFRIIFSSTLRKVSSNRTNEFKRYRLSDADLKKYNPDTIKEFSRTYAIGLAGMSDLYKIANTLHETRVIRADTRHFTTQPKADLIVTSPPYGDSKTTVAYGQFSSFAIDWMGLQNMSPLALDNALLGGNGATGRAFENSSTLRDVIAILEKKDEDRARDVESFFNDFERCLEMVSRGIKKDGMAVFVTGNRFVRHVKIPMDEILDELSEKWFTHDSVHFRVIHWKRIPSKVRQAKAKPVKTMDEETITVLKRK